MFFFLGFQFYGPYIIKGVPRIAGLTAAGTKIRNGFPIAKCQWPKGDLFRLKEGRKVLCMIVN